MHGSRPDAGPAETKRLLAGEPPRRRSARRAVSRDQLAIRPRTSRAVQAAAARATAGDDAQVFDDPAGRRMAV
jgi:hypothetical protein